MRCFGRSRALFAAVAALVATAGISPQAQAGPDSGMQQMTIVGIMDAPIPGTPSEAGASFEYTVVIDTFVPDANEDPRRGTYIGASLGGDFEVAGGMLSVSLGAGGNVNIVDNFFGDDALAVVGNPVLSTEGFGESNVEYITVLLGDPSMETLLDDTLPAAIQASPDFPEKWIEMSVNGQVVTGTITDVQVEGVDIPAVGEWGLVVMTLLALTAGTVVFGDPRRRAT